MTNKPDSSFAEAHRVFSSEPIFIEYEVKIRSEKYKMGETNEECEERVEERSNTQAHETWMI